MTTLYVQFRDFQRDIAPSKGRRKTNRMIEKGFLAWKKHQRVFPSWEMELAWTEDRISTERRFIVQVYDEEEECVCEIWFFESPLYDGWLIDSTPVKDGCLSCDSLEAWKEYMISKYDQYDAVLAIPYTP